MTAPHPFDVAMALQPLTRTPGAAALIRSGLHAVDTHPDRIGEPLAVTVNFAGPVADGEFDISLRAARAALRHALR